jgi:hypothetical protein
MRAIRIQPWLAAEIKFIDFNDAAELIVVRQHQTQGMPHAPRRLLTDAEGFGQTHGRNPFIRLKNKPQTGQPRPQRQLG